MNIKEVLFTKCQTFVENRLQTIQNTINEIQESLTSETKSSAGDKHETGRAMLQLEREKTGHQLAEIQKLKENLTKVDINSSSQTIAIGSVVCTSQFNYFIAISAGELVVGDVNYFAISPSTPIGKLLIGKTVGDQVEFKEEKLSIRSVL